jgi:hypothetical protein
MYSFPSFFFISIGPSNYDFEEALTYDVVGVFNVDAVYYE